MDLFAVQPVKLNRRGCFWVSRKPRLPFKHIVVRLPLTWFDAPYKTKSGRTTGIFMCLQPLCSPER